MNKNIKITLGSIYLIILISFLYFLFTKFDISRIDDFSYYKTIQENIDNTMFTLKMDGFLEVNKLQATSILDRTKLLLEGNGNIQAAYLFKADDSTDDKTNFNLIIVI